MPPSRQTITGRNVGIKITLGAARLTEEGRSMAYQIFLARSISYSGFQAEKNLRNTMARLTVKVTGLFSDFVHREALEIRFVSCDPSTDFHL